MQTRAVSRPRSRLRACFMCTCTWNVEYNQNQNTGARRAARSTYPPVSIGDIKSDRF